MQTRRTARVGVGALTRRCDAKRLVDVLGALVLLLVCLPALVLIGCAIRMSSPGPALFRQVRLGRDQTPFVMLKLRSMQFDCSDEVHQAYVRRLLDGDVEPMDGLYKLDNDVRVTRIGSFLRRTSLDELPQLWNVLRGEMSLVGPRPALPWETELFPAWARLRYRVRPGITGLWQVSGRNRLSMLDGLLLDVRYVNERSLVMDLVILLKTVRAVFDGGAR